MTGSPLSILKIKSNDPQPEGNFNVGWQSTSNIALVKYWGKKEGQLPVNPSLSMTLDQAYTQTWVHVAFDESEKGLISVNDNPQHSFLPKMQHLFQWLLAEIPELGKLTLRAETLNSFPHSTGIASSASGLSAFAFCLTSIAQRLTNAKLSKLELQQIASYISRIGSGSACRSAYEGFTVWGRSEMVKDSSDEFAVPINDHVHRDLKNLHDAIHIVSSDPKKLSSSHGHQAMKNHPFLSSRILQANKNLDELLHALKGNDFEHLATIAENEALTLHALLMTINPGTILMQAATIEIIHLVREARQKGLPLFFTLDAGANVHVMYTADMATEVEIFIRNVLQPLCENGRVIFDQCGTGPFELDENSR
jgi:diphosphomevalonate decarboxylase